MHAVISLGQNAKVGQDTGRVVFFVQPLLRRAFDVSVIHCQT